MIYEVYLDRLFLLNLWMSFLLIETACMISDRQLRHGRNFGVSCLYSVGYCIVIMIPAGSIQTKSLIFQFLSFVLFLLFHRKQARKQTAKEMLGFYFSAFGMLGIMEWIHMSRRPLSVVLAGTTGGILLMVLIRLYRFLFLSEKDLCEVLLQCGTHREQLIGLLDSGNLLTEPVSQCMVHIITDDGARRLALAERKERFRVIPYHSVGKKQGLLEGYFADFMIVKNGEREIRLQNPCIGIYEGELSGNGNYGILLNSKTFQ